MDEQVLGERYELFESIGSGGAARVHRARDRILGRDVAVKILHADGGMDPAVVQRFRREARAAAALNDPHIVAVYDSGSLADTYYIVMEYVEGPNLKDVIRNGSLLEEQALDIAIQVAIALGVAHEHGIVHRDVKPQNILLRGDGRVKVVDFGIARYVGLTQLTQTNAVTGTAHYLAPEQALGRPADNRSDIYSLGVVLYEMLTGHEPFDGSTLLEVALLHVHQAPVPLASVRPEISWAAEAVVMKAMEKDPSARFSTMKDMQDALRRAKIALENQRQTHTTMAPLVSSALRERVRQDASRANHERGRRQLSRVLMALPILILLFAGAVALAVFGRGSSTHGRTALSAPSGSGRAHIRKSATVKPAPSARQRGKVSSHSSTRHIPRQNTPAVAAAQPPQTLASANTSSTAAHAVEDFYTRVTTGDLKGAESLWTQRMQAYCPPASCIYSRFAGTQSIRVQSLKVLSQDETAGTAAVAVTLLEYKNGSPQPSVLYGTWYLVRGASGWMLNGESFA